MTAADAVTWLFVPGDRHERFAKAQAAGAEEVIIDLEDAVVVANKVKARTAAADWLLREQAWARINAPGTPWYDDDVAALRTCPGLRGIVVPKAERPDTTADLRQQLAPSVELLLLVETARGLERVAQLACGSGVSRLAFGTIDFALDVGCEETNEALLFARSQLVLASRLAGLPAPVDGVSTDVASPVTGAAARYARSLGFGGKLCIHPVQVEPVAAAFRPTAEQIAWARRVVDATNEGAGAQSLEGHMVDLPVAERARQLLARVR